MLLSAVRAAAAAFACPLHTTGNKLCIVMEYAPAGDLSSFLKAAAASRLPLPEATVWQIFLQLCQGMQVGSDVWSCSALLCNAGGDRQAGRSEMEWSHA